MTGPGAARGAGGGRAGGGVHGDTATAGPHSDAAMVGGPQAALSDDEVRAFVHDQLSAVDVTGARVCVLVPDATRRCPLPLLLSAVHESLHGRARHLTVLVALGTHTAMPEPALATHLGYAPGGLDDRYPGTTVANHAWWDPTAFAAVGTVPAGRVAELTEGRLARVNRAVVEHDLTLIVGPVLPHEVVGFSGGNKYLYPGVSGRELIDLSHWLGALITSERIIGVPGVTPVRALIDEAAVMTPGWRLALSAVTRPGHPDLHALAFGEPRASWAAAAKVSAVTHVRTLDAPVRRVLSLVPPRYDDLWTGAKGFYKVEPVVADGGQVVLHAPHITAVSPAHPAVEQVGYHCRDYFVKQWDRFRHLPWGDLAHSTHLRGVGTWGPVDGEHDRVTVTLATGIPEATTRALNLDYLDPATIDVEAWAADPGTLVVPDAGEDLYRLRAEGGPGREQRPDHPQRSSGSCPRVSGTAQKRPTTGSMGTNVQRAATEKRSPTSARAPNTTRPTTAPTTPAATHQPATDARTDVGNSSLSNEPTAGAKTPPASTPSMYPPTRATSEPL
jgi:nickel-dependent lactate racemase